MMSQRCSGPRAPREPPRSQRRRPMARNKTRTLPSCRARHAGPMPALSGSLTYARLFVEGPLPDDYRTRFIDSLRARAMKPLDAEDDASERSGFCAFGDPYQLELDYERV